jgi:hypothetical protein
LIAGLDLRRTGGRPARLRPVAEADIPWGTKNGSEEKVDAEDLEQGQIVDRNEISVDRRVSEDDETVEGGHRGVGRRPKGFDGIRQGDVQGVDRETRGQKGGRQIFHSCRQE